MWKAGVDTCGRQGLIWVKGMLGVDTCGRSVAGKCGRPELEN